MDTGATGPELGIKADPDFSNFCRFVEFYCRQFKNRSLLDSVNAKKGHKEFVFQYYENIFVRPDHIYSRHLKWFSRLRPIMSSLQRGSTILDYGAGYGMDSIYLSYCGYKVVFYEISPDHVNIFSGLRAVWEREMGKIAIDPVLAHPGRDENLPPVDAIMMDEVAHHIEPTEELFQRCARILPPKGKLFLLEPNALNPLVQAYFFRVRGFKTVVPLVDERTGKTYLYGNEHIRSRGRWDRLATQAGLRPGPWYPIIPYFMNSIEALDSPLRRRLASTPGIRSILASHITYEYIKPAA